MPFLATPKWALGGHHECVLASLESYCLKLRPWKGGMKSLQAYESWAFVMYCWKFVLRQWKICKSTIVMYLHCFATDVWRLSRIRMLVVNPFCTTLHAEDIFILSQLSLWNNSGTPCSEILRAWSRNLEENLQPSAQFSPCMVTPRASFTKMYESMNREIRQLHYTRYDMANHFIKPQWMCSCIFLILYLKIKSLISLKIMKKSLVTEYNDSYKGTNLLLWIHS